MNLPLSQTVVDSADAHRQASYGSVDWAAVIAGGTAAAAIAIMLIGFGSAIGLTLTSARPYSGVSGTFLAIVVALWFALVQIASFAAGGYITGRMRKPHTLVESERHFRDGAHGFLVWTIGTLVGAYFIASIVGSIASKGVDTAARVAEAAGTAVATQANNPAAQRLLDYNVDRLLRRTGPPPNASEAARDTTLGLETSRIMANAVFNNALDPRDREYLAAAIAARSNVPPTEALTRVDEAYRGLLLKKNEAEEKLRSAAETARKTSVVVGFLTAAVSLLGLLAATWAASQGGRDRDDARDLTFFGTKRLW